jgi:hypothetical protein
MPNDGLLGNDPADPSSPQFAMICRKMWVTGHVASNRISSRALKLGYHVPQGTPTMRDLIGCTLGHYRIVEKIGEDRCH